MPKKILLADDSITIQKVVELTFSDGDYEVTAVNNGKKAIDKLGEMRPDIILSDIIMPEKNGYEVCEFVKSHPEYRTIPVILLTGTFEPFDPDRADKAGCDAVVTKPFESQSLIHKVDELIEQSRSKSPTAPSASAPAAPRASSSSSSSSSSSWADENAPTAKTPSPYAAPPPPPPTPPSPAPDAFTHASDIFAAPPKSAPPTSEMPFASNQASTVGIPVNNQPAFGGETRAFPKSTFDKPMPPSTSSSEPSDDSPFGAPPPADMFSSETRAVPKLSLDEMKKLANTGAPATPPASESSSSAPWGEQPSAFSGETRAFPKMSFDDLDKSAGASKAPGGSSLWDEPAAATPAWSAPEPAAAKAPAASEGNGLDLTDEQVDRIARRVVELMSDQVVRNIAWEVIPDLAEMVVKERIRQLEAE